MKGAESVKLMVIDGNSLINRAYYGIRMLNTRTGTPTNAVYGFLMIYRSLLTEEVPDAVCVAFDLKAPTFRHGMFEGYKAKRKPMPDELAVQVPLLKEVLDAMNARRCEREGYEADDLIGAMASKCEKNGWECVIVTGDKDSFQLISDTTRVRHVRSRLGNTETKLYGVREFFEEYGFSPEKMVDLKALMGDASDNIPGVAGIGEKTAMALVQRFGGVNDIYKSLQSPEIKDSVRVKLEAGRNSAETSYALALIDRAAPLELEPSCCFVVPPDNDKLYELFQKLEFAKLTEKFGLAQPGTQKTRTENTPAIKTAAVQTAADSADMILALSKAPVAAVSLSTDSRVLAAVAGDTAYVASDGGTDRYMEVLTSVFDKSIKKTAHNVKEATGSIKMMGFESGGFEFDTALAAYLLDPTASSYELSRLTEKYCGYEMENGNEDNGQLSLMENTESGVKLIIAEAEAVGRLTPILSEKLGEAEMAELLLNIELPLCEVLSDMERTGFLVDRGAIETFREELSARVSEVEKLIFSLVGEEFNVNSPKQLGAVLFDRLLLPAPKKTKTGWSTNAEVLERLRGKHPVIPLVLDYRQLTKLKNTYCDGLLKVIAPDGRIHTSFQMTVTATGRLSSTEPNLQNIPIRRALGGEIRRMFVAAQGNMLVDADYSQIELRLLAHISGDETMINAFKNGEDIHTVTASQVLGIKPSEVTPGQRSSAKAVNFGIVYGISAFSLSQDIGVSVAEARKYMEGYFEKYHGVRDYMERVVAEAKNNGYVTTLYGRRRYLPELTSSNRNISAFGERVALNAPIQGTAADIMKIAMIRAHARLKNEVPKAKLILQVHDELLAECPQDSADNVMRILKEEMEGAANLSVPLTADAAAGKTWYDAK